MDFFRPRTRLRRGPVATSGVPYRAIAPNACRGGVWTPAAGEQLTGVVYVPCGVQLSTGTVAATIAAEGPVRIIGSGLRIGPVTPAAPAVVTAATGPEAVSITGSNVSMVGAVRAVAGARP